MKDFGKILTYIVGVLLLACLLTPPMFWIGRAAPENDWLAFLGSESALREYLYRVLATSDFERYFNRAVLVAAVLLLWPLVRWLHIRSAADFGLAPNQQRFTDLGLGFVAAVLPLGLLAVVAISVGWYEPHDPLPWRRVGSILATAITVSLIEELLFRGAFLGLIRRTAGPWISLIAVSAIFSIIHFMKPPDRSLEAEEVTWVSGFELLPYTLEQFGEPLLLLGGFTTLFLGGWILGWATLKTKSLWMALGLHAGWIVAVQGMNRFTRREVDDLQPWLGPNLYVGLIPLVIVAITGLVVWRLVRDRQRL